MIPMNEEDYYDYLDEMSGPVVGDCRRCPNHPHIAIGSPCGMFDGLCGECEANCDAARHEADESEYPTLVMVVAPEVIQEMFDNVDDIPF